MLLLHAILMLHHVFDFPKKLEIDFIPRLSALASALCDCDIFYIIVTNRYPFWDYKSFRRLGNSVSVSNREVIL